MKRSIGILLLLCLVNFDLSARINHYSLPGRKMQPRASEAGRQAQSTAEKRFTPEEMSEDLSFMLRTFEEVHPNLYYYTPKTEIDALKAEVIRSLTKPLTEREFFPMVARLSAKFGDGHTNASSPPSRRTYLDNGGLTFPFDIKRTTKGIIVRQSYADNSAVGSGDRILSINGVEVDQLFGQLLNEVSGETLAYRTVLVENSFKPMLWTHEIWPPFNIEYESKKTGQRQTETVPGLTSQALTQRQQGSSQGQNIPYRYQDLAGGIGYLNFRSMGGERAAFEAFLEVTFKLIKSEKVKGLIVDLRENSGGNSALGESLLSYLTNKPYKMADRKEWKVSRPYREYLRSNTRLRPNPRYMEAKDGEILVSKGELRTPPNNSLRFDGPVCFLIGSYTFSSAMMLANAVGDFKLATLIGEETGDPPNSFGEVYSFNLPHSKLSINVSTAQFVRANGDGKDKHPVLPDIKVTLTENDLERQVDTVLEFAKKWVLQQAEQSKSAK